MHPFYFDFIACNHFDDFHNRTRPWKCTCDFLFQHIEFRFREIRTYFTMPFFMADVTSGRGPFGAIFISKIYILPFPDVEWRTNSNSQPSPYRPFIELNYLFLIIWMEVFVHLPNGPSGWRRLVWMHCLRVTTTCERITDCIRLMMSSSKYSTSFCLHSISVANALATTARQLKSGREMAKEENGLEWNSCHIGVLVMTKQCRRSPIDAKQRARPTTRRRWRNENFYNLELYYDCFSAVCVPFP